MVVVVVVVVVVGCCRAIEFREDINELLETSSVVDCFDFCCRVELNCAPTNWFNHAWLHITVVI